VRIFFDPVRIFFGNAGPSLISGFHIIGCIFDKGDLISPPANGIQTLVPGDFTLLDHSLFRLEKGAVGFIHVKGESCPKIYSSGPAIGKKCPNCGIHP